MTLIIFAWSASLDMGSGLGWLFQAAQETISSVTFSLM